MSAWWVLAAVVSLAVKAFVVFAIFQAVRRMAEWMEGVGDSWRSRKVTIVDYPRPQISSTPTQPRGLGGYQAGNGGSGETDYWQSRDWSFHYQPPGERPSTEWIESLEDPWVAGPALDPHAQRVFSEWAPIKTARIESGVAITVPVGLAARDVEHFVDRVLDFAGPAAEVIRFQRGEAVVMGALGQHLRSRGCELRWSDEGRFEERGWVVLTP